jgi:hypothetical protein
MLEPVNTSSSNKCFSRLQRAYYFSEEALLALFKGARLECTDIRIHARELENRARKVVMNRCVQRASCHFHCCTLGLVIVRCFMLFRCR